MSLAAFLIAYGVTVVAAFVMIWRPLWRSFVELVQSGKNPTLSRSYADPGGRRWLRNGALAVTLVVAQAWPALLLIVVAARIRRRIFKDAPTLPKLEHRHPVTEVRFELVVRGERRVAVFVRADKIEELMTEDGSLGDWLRAVADASLEDRIH